MNIEERIDVEALLRSIGSLQDLQFRQRGLEPDRSGGGAGGA